MREYLLCPHCKTPIDPFNIIGDSDWDEQQFDWVENECSNCGKQYKIRQWDVEVKRSFEIKGVEWIGREKRHR